MVADRFDYLADDFDCQLSHWGTIVFSEDEVVKGVVVLARPTNGLGLPARIFSLLDYFLLSMNSLR